MTGFKTVLYRFKQQTRTKTKFTICLFHNIFRKACSSDENFRKLAIGFENLDSYVVLFVINSEVENINKYPEITITTPSSRLNILVYKYNGFIKICTKTVTDRTHKVKKIQLHKGIKKLNQWKIIVGLNTFINSTYRLL